MPTKKKMDNLEWNVLRYNHNNRSFETFNIFNHWRFSEYIDTYNVSPSPGTTLPES